MLKLVTILGAAPKSGIKRDDDFVDRLSNRYTVGLIVVFAVIVSMTQWIGNPITCWCPKHFTGSHCKFTNSYCWVRNTYYLPYGDEIPRVDEEEDKAYIIYYQWMPFILLLQASLFYAPSIVWHGLNQKAGMDADHILQAAGKLSQCEEDIRTSNKTRLIVYQMDRFLRAPKSARQGWQMRFKRALNVICCQCFGARMGNYLVVLYLFSKLLYIANCVGQLFLLNRILRTDYINFGASFFRDFYKTDYDANPPVFPRVTMCDFEVRRLGNVQRYTVQCMLPINLYTERMYVFMWFWIIFIAIITFASFATWLARAMSHNDRLKFIRNHLRTVGYMDADDSDRLSAEYLDTYLKQDGAFLHRLIIHNTSNMCCTEIMAAQYAFWLDKVRGKKDITIDDDDDDDNSSRLLPT